MKVNLYKRFGSEYKTWFYKQAEANVIQGIESFETKYDYLDNLLLQDEKFKVMLEKNVEPLDMIESKEWFDAMKILNEELGLEEIENDLNTNINGKLILVMLHEWNDFY